MTVDHGSLKSRSVSASIWVLIGTVAGSVVRLLSNLLLTRLLFPEAFGLMLMASTVTFIVHMLSDLGIHQSIIRLSDNKLCAKGKVEVVCLVDGILSKPTIFDEAFKEYI